MLSHVHEPIRPSTTSVFLALSEAHTRPIMRANHLISPERLVFIAGAAAADHDSLGRLLMDPSRGILIDLFHEQNDSYH